MGDVAELLGLELVAPVVQVFTVVVQDLLGAKLARAAWFVEL